MCGRMQSSQAEAQPLAEDDLKLVARLGNLLTQRPLGPRGETMTHKVLTPSVLFSASAAQQNCMCRP